jgi:transposase
MKNVTTYVGIDAHRKDLFVATLVGTAKTPVTWQLANEAKAVHRLVRKLEREAPGPIRVFYEAGPCGYALQRQVTTSRVSCDVVAPALIPRKPGERVKTNRRDARKLVELAYLGLVPGEDSSGDKHRRGRITRTGNALVRRLLVETAWHYQHRPTVGVVLTRRRTGQPARVIAIADRAQQRLCRRFRKLAAEHKPAPKIAVAIARELAGFLWAALQPPPLPTT